MKKIVYIIVLASILMINIAFAEVLRNPNPVESEPVLLVKDKSIMDMAMDILRRSGHDDMMNYLLTVIFEGKTFTVNPDTRCKVLGKWGSINSGDLYFKVQILEGKNREKIGYILGGIVH